MDIKLLFERIVRVSDNYFLDSDGNITVKANPRKYYLRNNLSINGVLEVAEELGFRIFVNAKWFPESDIFNAEVNITDLKYDGKAYFYRDNLDQPTAFLSGLEKCVELLEKK